MTDPAAQTMQGASLTVKCLKCQNTYDIPGITVTLLPVLDPDTFEFVQYEVTFEHDEDGEAYLQDLLCVGKRSGCSVFGRLPDGSVFAFPCLRKSKADRIWVSFPDSQSKHFAIKRRSPA